MQIYQPTIMSDSFSAPAATGGMGNSGGDPFASSSFSPSGGFGGGSGPMINQPGAAPQSSGGGGAGMGAGMGYGSLSNFMQPMSSGVGGGMVPGQITSMQSNNPQLQQFSNLLHSLMQQSQGAYNSNLGAFKNLQSSVSGNLQNMGKLGGQQIDMGLHNQMGAMNQNMVSRGLGNTTVQNTMGQGLQRNAQMEHQQLNENVAQQQNATQMQMFGMNPAFNSQQYLSLLPQLGNLAASGMVK